jgi:DNA replication protein DnaC
MSSRPAANQPAAFFKRRYQRRSLILTSHMPDAHWHEQIGDPTIADSILDRLIHNAHRIELKGESLRKKRRKPGEEEPQ